MSSRYQSALVLSVLGLGVGLGSVPAGAQPLSFESMAADQANARLGASVASTETVAIVGAPDEDGPGGADQGAAYIYLKSGSGWLFLDKLVDPSGRGGDNFGQSVDISSDGLRIVVGAPGTDTGATNNHGAAFVFEFDGGWWQFKSRVVAAAIQSESRFGTSVAVSGQTIVAGAPRFDHGAVIDAGAVYIISAVSGVWTASAPMTVAVLERGRLGTSVDIDGDRIIAGAPAAGAGRGAAALFYRGSAGWAFLQSIVSADATVNQAFGSSVSIGGSRAAVGAPNDAGPAGAAQGAVYVFEPGVHGQGWLQVYKGRATDAIANDRLGSSVAVVGSRVVAGSPGSDLSERPNCGAAYTFYYATALVIRGWRQSDRINPSDAVYSTSAFGSSVGGMGATIIVGSPVEQEHYSEGGYYVGAGSAWVVALDGLGVGAPSRLGMPPQFPFQSDDNNPVAISGDIAVIGCPTATGPAGNGQGYANIVQRAGGKWYFRKRLYNPTGAAGLGFGRCVAINGTTIVVCQDGQAVIFEGLGVNGPAVRNLVGTAGAFGVSVAVNGDTILIGSYRSAGGEQGSVSVYTRGTGSWPLAATWTNPDGGVGGFGRAVALKGSVAVVGSPTQTFSGGPRGAAHVYTRSASGVWSRQYRLSPTGLTSGAEFGHSVSVDSGTIVVGAPKHASDGAAFVYHATTHPRALAPWGPAGTLVTRSASGARFGDTVAVSGNYIAVAGDHATGHVRFFCRFPGSTSWKPLRSHVMGPCYGTTTVALDGASAIITGGPWYASHEQVRIHCPGDFNMDGIISATDASLFANRFASGDARADFDDSGSVTPADATAYNAAFGAGCP